MNMFIGGVLVSLAWTSGSNAQERMFISSVDDISDPSSINNQHFLTKSFPSLIPTSVRNASLGIHLHPPPLPPPLENHISHASPTSPINQLIEHRSRFTCPFRRCYGTHQQDRNEIGVSCPNTSGWDTTGYLHCCFHNAQMCVMERLHIL